MRISVVDDQLNLSRQVSEMRTTYVSSIPATGVGILVVMCNEFGIQEFYFSSVARAKAARKLLLYDRAVSPETVTQELAA